MKSVYFHLLVALAIFAGCSESSDESLVVVDEISEGASSISLSSSPVSSSTPVSSSVTSSSSATDSTSSSKTSSSSSDVSSSSKQEPASSSSSEPSPKDLSRRHAFLSAAFPFAALRFSFVSPAASEMPQTPPFRVS